MVQVKVVVNGISQKKKITPESTLSQILRTHPAVSMMPAETVFRWGTIVGTGKPGGLRKDDELTIEVASPVITKCYTYQREGEFSEAIELDLNIASEEVLLNEINRRWPDFGREVQYYQGMEELPAMTVVAELLVFPKNIKRSDMDSPVAETAAAEGMRRVEPLRKIRWEHVDGPDTSQSELTDSVPRRMSS
jgi:hypothetical protein